MSPHCCRLLWVWPALIFVHGDEGWNNDADAASRADFYGRLDECMVEVVRLRAAAGNLENPQWNIVGDTKRLEKTGSFLREKLGLQAYFPRSLDVMHYEVKKSDNQMGRGAKGFALIFPFLSSTTSFAAF
jgi:hypothetical protein